MPLDVLATLHDLVAIPSVNPMGRDISGPEFFEYRVTDYLENLFRRLGVPYRRQPVDLLRDNIVAWIEGDPEPSAGPRVLLLEAHQDTVPVDGMTIDPWSPTVRDGRLYGRGACDIKGGMSAMLAAFARVAEQRPRGAPTLVMACTVNEEHGYTGATALARGWQSGAADVPHRRPDAVVVAEPTSLQVVVAHKGATRWRCRTHGRACHSSQPQRGDNAIYRMSYVLQALQRYQQEIAPTVPPHRLCGPVSLSVGTIRGGLSVNTVPDECTIEIDRRVIPGEDAASAYRHVVDYVTQQLGADFPVTHEAPFLVGQPLPDTANQAVAERLARAVRQVAPSGGEFVGVSYGTDAAVYAAAGVPSVVFGPGSIDQAHTADEWIDVEQLQQAAEILYRFICFICAAG
jgi:acetylornithine deacetylase/succinyl-diaminopimelate desuccinylase family protein